VQFKKSYRPNLEEIKQQLLLVRESANKIWSTLLRNGIGVDYFCG
jgi:hypothetical protein